MSKYVRIFALVLCCTLLLGAAPVLPTKGLYVNDYANVIVNEHRGRIFLLCTELEEDTGAQLAVLTVNDFGNISGEEYARSILSEWDIGGTDKQTGVLLLADVKSKQVVILAQPGIYIEDTQVLIDERILPAMKNGNASKGITEGAKAIALRIYEQYGVLPRQTEPEQPAQKKSSVFSVSSVILLIGAAFVVGRSLRVSSKYRKRYTKGHVYKRKTFVRSRQEDDYDRENPTDKPGYDD